MRFFITATGTDIGKTYITCALIHQLRQQNKTVHAVKPVMSGFSEENIDMSDAGHIALSLGKNCDMAQIEAISPYRYKAPLSVHDAAEYEGKSHPYDAMVAWCRHQCLHPADVVLIEGVGGVAVPLNWQHHGVDWMQALEIPVILVTGNYLGTLSHTITAVQMLVAHGITLQAIIVNEAAHSTINPVDTLRTLRHYIPHAAHVVHMPRCADYKDAKNIVEVLS